MYTLMKLTLGLLFTLQLNADYKGGKPAKLLDEVAERLQGCQERARHSYLAACSDRQKLEQLMQTIIAQNQEALFGNDADKAKAYEEITQKINSLIKEQIEKIRDKDLEQCQTKNRVLAQPVQSP